MRLFKVDKVPLIAAPYVLGRSLGRHRTCDTAIAFRMGAGFPGDVNRGHPSSIQPALNSPINPVAAYGLGVLIDTAGGANNGVRSLSGGDAAITDIWGVAVRPFPIQQSTTGNNYGAVPYGAIQPPLNQPIDVLRGGYIMVNVNGACVKGGAVFIWTGATGGGHTQGGFEATANGGVTTAVLNTLLYMYNSPPDSNGVAELILNKF